MAATSFGNILQAISAGAQVAGGVQALFADGGGVPTGITPAQARATGAGAKGITTPSFQLGLGARPTLQRRAGTVDAPLLEENIRQRIRGIQGGFAALAPRVGLSSQALGEARVGLEGLRTRSGELRADVEGIRTALGGRLGALREEVEPGFGRLTESRVRAVRDRRDEAVGNLRESLSRRKVLGASFAEDAIARTELAFTQEEEAARAESFVEELGFSRQLALDEAIQGGELEKVSTALLGLDAQALAQEVQNLAIDIGLTDQQAGLLSGQMTAIQQEMASLSQTLNREFTELGLTGDIANKVQTNINAISVASSDAALAAAEFQASENLLRGEAIAGLGEAGSTFAESIGGLFG